MGRVLQNGSVSVGGIVMTSRPARAEDGIIVRGSDGSFYFVTERDLQAFRLPEWVRSAVQQTLDADVQGFGLQPFVTLPEEALRAAGLPVAREVGGTGLFANNVGLLDFGVVSG